MAYVLPALPYALEALEPHIDATTMGIHHGKHHQAYVTNLNAALDKAPELGTHSLESLLMDLNTVPESIRMAVRNNGGGHWNHALFWEIMGPNAGGEPTGELGTAITGAFGSYSAFRDQLKAAGTTRFGSGWAWLLVKNGALTITSSPNQDSPLMEGAKPSDILLGVDVWEHAYYLKYQNRRPDYLDAWFNTINWANVGARYAAAR
jgi:superoxide dismutase, Fe-Mn family